MTTRATQKLNGVCFGSGKCVHWLWDEKLKRRVIRNTGTNQRCNFFTAIANNSRTCDCGHDIDFHEWNAFELNDDPVRTNKPDGLSILNKPAVEVAVVGQDSTIEVLKSTDFIKPKLKRTNDRVDLDSDNEWGFTDTTEPKSNNCNTDDSSPATRTSLQHTTASQPAKADRLISPSRIYNSTELWEVTESRLIHWARKAKRVTIATPTIDTTFLTALSAIFRNYNQSECNVTVNLFLSMPKSQDMWESWLDYVVDSGDDYGVEFLTNAKFNCTTTGASADAGGGAAMCFTFIAAVFDDHMLVQNMSAHATKEYFSIILPKSKAMTKASMLNFNQRNTSSTNGTTVSTATDVTVSNTVGSTYSVCSLERMTKIEFKERFQRKCQEMCKGTFDDVATIFQQKSAVTANRDRHAYNGHNVNNNRHSFVHGSERDDDCSIKTKSTTTSQLLRGGEKTMHGSLAKIPVDKRTNLYRYNNVDRDTFSD